MISRRKFLLAALSGAILGGCSHRKDWAEGRKVVVLGIDGLDPRLLRQYTRTGCMPNFERLEREGSYRELALPAAKTYGSVFYAVLLTTLRSLTP